ncbi:MAG TPA: type II toxin-antitoxin system RelE/ParE family toxin [Terriglobia bacterium]|nr:type II toxin-antitoxin system RelE/ParE family toxin [Terriglobia bacterium]
MPTTKLIFFREPDGTAPAVEWLTQLRKENGKAFAKCRVRLDRLALMGHELRRPEADYLRDDIYELRTRLGTVNYRMLYFFHGRQAVVVSHGFTKEADVPRREIEQAIARRRAFLAEPSKHTYEREVE